MLTWTADTVRQLIGNDRYDKLRLGERLRRYLMPLMRQCCRSDLVALARLYQTDKWGSHWYAQHYQRHFQSFRKRPLRLLEIGVGGYNRPNEGGASLRMWKSFFPRGHVFGLDIEDKSALAEDRITILRGSQADAQFLRDMAAKHGPFDIIIDDGSHVSEHIILTFNTLFPHLVDRGIYAIEDLQTSYWPEWGGSEDITAGHTSMNLCKSLLDGLNWEEIRSRQPGCFDAKISEVHCYHNLVVVQKGRNEENRASSASRVSG